MLLESDTQLVQASYRKLAADADTLAEAFYQKLFEHDPRLRYLFPEDLSAVRDHLLQMIAFAVRRIDQTEEVRHRLANLGARHAAYGVRPQDYDTFLVAVMETLGDHLRLPVDDDVMRAWKAFFTWVAKTMIDGAAVTVAR